MTTVDWVALTSDDAHRWQSLVVGADRPLRVLVWLPALGVPARNYQPFAQSLAARGVSVVVHEWRGFGSSSLRASRTCTWGYEALLTRDIPATWALAASRFGALPRVIGGHSLGGQLSCCALALDRGAAEELWLVASGAPWHRAFPRGRRWWLPWAYRLLAALARLFGALPGRRIGFGGQEARGVIADWSRTALTGRYGAPGIGDLEPILRTVAVPVHAVLLEHDWLAPRSSLDYLLSKLGDAKRSITTLDDAALGARADHFNWMKAPDAVADALLRA